LGYAGIGKVNEEKPIITKSGFPLQWFPNKVIVGPSLQKNNKVFAFLVSFKKIFQRREFI
jgi:hypothetical protein